MLPVIGAMARRVSEFRSFISLPSRLSCSVRRCIWSANCTRWSRSCSLLRKPTRLGQFGDQVLGKRLDVLAVGLVAHCRPIAGEKAAGPDHFARLRLKHDGIDIDLRFPAEAAGVSGNAGYRCRNARDVPRTVRRASFYFHSMAPQVGHHAQGCFDPVQLDNLACVFLSDCAVPLNDCRCHRLDQQGQRDRPVAAPSSKRGAGAPRPLKKRPGPDGLRGATAPSRHG